MENKNMLASILFSLMGFLSMAQGATPPPPMPPPPPGLPIDNGVAILFFVAIFFGAYRILRLKKQNT
ncbi:hypothetical protein [Winogradskyella alexanderae]|jgi:hypothetical protein|uniref:Signal peptidase n=1 Tax=Winogradskyella alexanderae TaxID=2877123 RepID=A0ABS7XMK6_9FLAO|nr:hypothetical protein [Winogradskyella alexanderae]MCA0131237.1 hypothetical protein [Winogradskyella alexanderae]